MSSVTLYLLRGRHYKKACACERRWWLLCHAFGDERGDSSASTDRLDINQLDIRVVRLTGGAPRDDDAGDALWHTSFFTARTIVMK